MSEFYVTFGKAHVGSMQGAHPDGYITIVAEDYEEAREFAFDSTQGRFAFIYIEKPSLDFFPLGETAKYTLNRKTWSHL